MSEICAMGLPSRAGAGALAIGTPTTLLRTASGRQQPSQVVEVVEGFVPVAGLSLGG
jgi:hypothetical protein